MADLSEAPPFDPEAPFEATETAPTFDPEAAFSAVENTSAFIPDAIVEEDTEGQTIGDIVLRQVGLTGRAVAEGLAGTVGIASDPLGDAIRSAINFATDNDIPRTELRDTVSKLLTAAGVPSPENKTEEIVQHIVQAMAGGGGTAGLAKGVSKVVSSPTAKAVSSTLAAQPTAQIVGAGTGQASAEIAKEAGVGEAGQLAAGLVGGLAGGGLASLKNTPKPSQLTDDIAAVEQQGVRVLTSDIKTPESFAAKWLQSTGEKIPVAGTGPVRVKQQAERVAAIKNVLVENGADDAMNVSDDVMNDLLRTRSLKIHANTQAKHRVIDALEESGPVDVRQTVSTIDAEIARLKSLGTEEMTPVIAKLNDFKSAIQNQGIKNVEQLRKQLGESFSAPELASVKSTSSSSINNIYGSLREDMGNFIAANGGPKEHQKWLKANKRLAKMIGELDKSALKTALNKGTATPEMIKGLLFSKKASDVRSLYKNLSPKGRATARAAILGDIADKSTANGVLSPQKFMTNLDKSKDRIGVFFSGDKAKQLKGLQKALQLTERASVAGVSTPTGVQLAIPVSAAILTDLVGGAGAALATGASLGGFARLYESKPMRDALMALSRASIKPSEEAAILKRIISLAQTHKKKTEDKE